MRAPTIPAAAPRMVHEDWAASFMLPETGATACGILGAAVHPFMERRLGGPSARNPADADIVAKAAKTIEFVLAERNPDGAINSVFDALQVLAKLVLSLPAGSDVPL